MSLHCKFVLFLYIFCSISYWVKLLQFMVPFSSSSDHVLCLVICFTNSPVHKFFELFPDFDGKEEILDLHLWEELSWCTQCFHGRPRHGWVSDWQSSEIRVD